MRLRRNVWGGAFRNRLAAANEATKNIKIKIRQTTDATIGGRLRDATGPKRHASPTPLPPLQPLPLLKYYYPLSEQVLLRSYSP